MSEYMKEWDANERLVEQFLEVNRFGKDFIKGDKDLQNAVDLNRLIAFISGEMIHNSKLKQHIESRIAQQIVENAREEAKEESVA